jgi:O-antigen/teichoic acid export membrane protein
VISPLLLVRILDVASFGQYQEFVIYAVLLVALSTFAVDSSLTYFLPRYPERERQLVSQTTAVNLITSATCISALLLAKPLLLRIASYDFVAPLAAYVFFFANFNWLEYYWIAKRQPRNVLWYSALRMLVRVTVMLVVAYMTHDVLTIVWSMAAVEVVRVALIAAYLVRRGIFVRDFRRTELAEQLRFAAPIGASTFVQQSGRNLGKLVISSTLGPAGLAFFAIGSYLQPIVRVARSGIEDSIFPELVRAHAEPGGPLRLWQRVNVLWCVLLFPAFVLLVHFAEVIITTLFTRAYLPAVPVFQIFALFLLRRCFNTDVLLRTTGRTGFMLWGVIGALAINITLIALLSRTYGIIGPAIAFIAAEIALEVYFGQRARRFMKLGIADLIDWRSILRITTSCVLALPILIAFERLPGPQLVLAAVASVLYFAAVLLLAHRFGVDDVGRVTGFVWSKVSGKSR